MKSLRFISLIKSPFIKKRQEYLRITFLNMGTHGAHRFKTNLPHSSRENAFARQLRSTYGVAVPAFADFRHYYMGLHVQSCVQMCYKRQFTPSYLLIDAESGSFVPTEACRPLIAAPTAPMSNEANETINLLEG